MTHWKGKLKLLAIGFTEKLQFLSKLSATVLLGSVQVFSGIVVGTLRKLHTGARVIEPWTILLVSIGVLISILGFLGDLESRMSDREFRSWQTVHNFEQLLLRKESQDDTRLLAARDLRQALEFLNQKFAGVLCITKSESEIRPWLSLLWYTRILTQDPERPCIIPARKTRALLSGLRASGIILQNVQLPGAMLERAEFSRSDLSNANLSGATLFNAKFKDGSYLNTNFSNTCLLAADFSGSSLIDADFSGAYLVGVDFRNTELNNVNFSGAVITDHYVVDKMLKYIDKQEKLETRSGGKAGLFSVIIEALDEVKANLEFFVSETNIANSAFAEKCGHILPQKLERFSSRFAVGVFADKINSDIRKYLSGANFMDASGLEADQFQGIACPNPLNTSSTPRPSPKNLPQQIVWNEERCESPKSVDG